MKLAPDPRPIDDAMWAKLMATGLNIAASDFQGSAYGPKHARIPTYPFEMVKALIIIWLFGGLRLKEIIRLRCGAVSSGTLRTSADADEQSSMLRVPPNKTSGAYTKPVDVLVGEAVRAWEAIRPTQGKLLDQKTGELVDFLFAFRGRRIGYAYLNRVIIRTLCEKAGVPLEDERGGITVHRGRTTIATQLFNAKNPMSLFELQEWLGHKSPHSTQYYAKLSPLKLQRSFEKADYFRQNLRTISALVDHDAIRSGATADEKRAYLAVDLTHGYCTYDFYSKCPHRMACIKCSFYIPKESSRAQHLEANDHNQRVLLSLELTEPERAAIEDRKKGVISLLEMNFNLPAPDGSTRKIDDKVELTGGEDEVA